MRLVFQKAPRVAVQNEKVFRRVVKAAFAQRRKTLRNALQAVGYDDLKAVGERVKINMQRRGETLSLAEFATLADVFAEQERDLVLTGHSL